METRNRLTDLRVEEVEGCWKKLANEHIHIYAKSMDTDNHVKASGECRGWVEGEKGGEKEVICNSVNNKKVFKK